MTSSKTSGNKKLAKQDDGDEDHIGEKGDQQPCWSWMNCHLPGMMAELLSLFVALGLAGKQGNRDQQTGKACAQSGQCPQP